VIVHFVDIGGIVDRHCLNSLFIIFLVFSTQIHNFERSFSLSSGPKAVLFRLAGDTSKGG
jgi:hypothetical protein